MTIEQIRSEIIRLGEGEGVEITCPIEMNGRLKTTLGRVCYKWDTDHAGKIIPSKIEFSKMFIETASKEEIENTVAHEAAHAIISYKTGTKHGHDAMWKALHKKLGGDGERCSSTPRVNAKYTVICSKCGKITDRYYRAGKVVKHPEWYKSCCCGATLEVIQNY